jgi:hypothetical protein
MTRETLDEINLIFQNSLIIIKGCKKNTNKNLSKIKENMKERNI